MKSILNICSFLFLNISEVGDLEAHVEKLVKNLNVACNCTPPETEGRGSSLDALRKHNFDGILMT